MLSPEVIVGITSHSLEEQTLSLQEMVNYTPESVEANLSSVRRNGAGNTLRVVRAGLQHPRDGPAVVEATGASLRLGLRTLFPLYLRRRDGCTADAHADSHRSERFNRNPAVEAFAT